MISEDIISKYKEDGVIILKNVIEWMDWNFEGVEKILKIKQINVFMKQIKIIMNYFMMIIVIGIEEYQNFIFNSNMQKLQKINAII